MKKILVIMVLGFLWCSIGFAKTIDQRLDDIEKSLKAFDLDKSCAKLEQSGIEDYKIEFFVDKIAFEDNSILSFK